MRFVVARPLNAVELFQPLVSHTRMHGTQGTQPVPDAFRIRLAPAAARALREFVDNFHVVADAFGQRNSGTHALHAALATRHCTFGFAPSGGTRKDDMGKL